MTHKYVTNENDILQKKNYFKLLLAALTKYTKFVFHDDILLFIEFIGVFMILTSMLEAY